MLSCSVVEGMSEDASVQVAVFAVLHSISSVIHHARFENARMSISCAQVDRRCSVRWR
jgi:hypothetical protein